MYGARRGFVVEGVIEIGPRGDYFAFVDGEFLGRLLSRHAGVELKEGQYTRLGRARITVEWLDDDEATEGASLT
jgi:hypothetical protein